MSLDYSPTIHLDQGLFSGPSGIEDDPTPMVILVNMVSWTGAGCRGQSHRTSLFGAVSGQRRWCPIFCSLL